MTLSKKIEDILIKIKNYTYQPNGIYLYPLNEHLQELRHYLNHQSDNVKFNGYIKELLLPGLDYYVGICTNDNHKKMYEEDVNIIKEGVMYWYKHFKSACSIFLVPVLEQEIIL